jgi:hypothetical protein
MNNQRRKRLRDIIKEILVIQGKLQDVFDEEQESLDNLPENLQGTDRYANMEEYCDKMSDGISLLDEVVEIIEEVIG